MTESHWNETLKKLTGSLFLKDLISAFVLTLLIFLKKNCRPYFHDIFRESGQNQANARSSVLKLKHPLRNTCSGKKICYI